MNIYAKKGDKVVFARPTAGYDYHQALAKKHLVVGSIYTVQRTRVSPWHTDVFLKEVPGIAFNSVLFKDLADWKAFG